MRWSTGRRDLALWLGLSEAAVYLGFLGYFLWQLVLAIR
jgi:hypothetical protein